jgi:hypothetical protein
MARTANASYPMKIACLIKTAADAGHPFICGLCGRPILPGQAVQFDHTQAVGRGGDNRVEDLRPVHSASRGTLDAEGHALDCHYRKTFRPRSGATTIGGDNYEAKKTDRLGATHKVNKLPTGTRPAKPPAQAMRSRKFPTQQRGFAPRGARPMNKKRRA